jgi:hypothetical protein
MTDNLLRKLHETLAQIEAERDRLAQQAEHFRSVIAYYEAQAGAAENQAAGPRTLKNDLWHILQAAGGPLHYKDLYQRLRARGVHVPGTDPARNVGAHLSADPRFVSLGGGMWGLKAWPQSRGHDPSPQPKATMGNLARLVGSRPSPQTQRPGSMSLTDDDALRGLGLVDPHTGKPLDVADDQSG